MHNQNTPPFQRNKRAGSPSPQHHHHQHQYASIKIGDYYASSKNLTSHSHAKNKRPSNNYIKVDYSTLSNNTQENFQRSTFSNYDQYTNNPREEFNTKPKTPLPTSTWNNKMSKADYRHSKVTYNYDPKYKNDPTNYQKLHDKLNMLQTKISQIKSTFEINRQEKRRFLQNQQNQLKKIKENKKNKKENQQYNPLKQFVTQVPQHKELHAFHFNPYSPRHNVYYVSEILRAYKEEKSLPREHVRTSMNILKMFEKAKLPSKQDVMKRSVKLERKKGYEDKKTLIFDLDETLIHCNESLNMLYDVKLPIKFPNGEFIEAGINVRPYAKDILKALYKKFQIIVFTASHSSYANVVLNYLDPQNMYIQHRLYRQHCFHTPQGVFVKDLRIIDRQTSNMILVDNAAYSYAYQVDNGIPIIPYYQGKIDYQLRALQDYLQKLTLVKDVREINRKTFKINQYNNYDEIEHLVKDLYYEYLK